MIFRMIQFFLSSKLRIFVTTKENLLFTTPSLNSFLNKKNVYAALETNVNERFKFLN